MDDHEAIESPERSQRSTRNQAALYSSRYHPMDEVTRPRLSQRSRGGYKPTEDIIALRPDHAPPLSRRAQIRSPNIISPSSAPDAAQPSSCVNRRNLRAATSVAPGAYNRKFHPMDAELRPVQTARTLGKRAVELLLSQQNKERPLKRPRDSSEDELGNPGADAFETVQCEEKALKVSPAIPSPPSFSAESPIPNLSHEYDELPTVPFSPDSDARFADQHVHRNSSFPTLVTSPNVSRLSSAPSWGPHSRGASLDPQETAGYDADDESEVSHIDASATSADYDAGSDAGSVTSSNSWRSILASGRKGLTYGTVTAREFLVESDNPWLQQPKSIFRHMTLLDRRLYKLQQDQPDNGKELPLPWEAVIARLVMPGDILVTRGDILVKKGNRLVVKGDTLVEQDQLVTFEDFERWGGIPALRARYAILRNIVQGSALLSSIST